LATALFRHILSLKQQKPLGKKELNEFTEAELELVSAFVLGCCII